jgi:uracil-DNA glycosylase
MRAVGSQGETRDIARALLAHVTYQRLLGAVGAPAATLAAVQPRAAERPAPTARIGSSRDAQRPVPAPARAAATGSVQAAADVAGETLDEVRLDLGDCRRCKLAGGRTNLVYGVGDPHARLVFVGEGPGADEDAKGEPFVGRAGQLLTEIITKGMKLRREDVYICNVVKCRPPGNRNPEPDEVAACEPFLVRQLRAIGPEVIVALGKFAAQTLLRSKTPITQLRGRWFDYQGIMLMPTFHPAYLLRNPGDKRLVWEDIQKVMRVLGLPIVGR